MFKQVNDANMNTPYIGGYCEGFVEMCWGQATMNAAHTTTYGVYASAIAAWNAEPNKHYDLPPVGKTVPVYFSLGNVPQGHAAVSLDDGGAASSSMPGYHTSPYFYPNLNALIADYGKYNGGCTYLGWGEHVGHIVAVAPTTPNATVAQIKQDYLDILERPADDSGIAHYQNYTNDFVRNDLLSSAEYQTLQANKAAAAKQALDSSNYAAAQAKILADQKAASDKAIADAKAATDAELAKTAVANNQFITRLRSLLQIIIDFIVKLKG